MKRLKKRAIERTLWLRALHVKDAAGDSANVMLEDVTDMLMAQMDRAEEMLLAAARPGGVYRVMERADVLTEGVSIERHLEGCHQVVIMAVTLGADVDALLRKMQISDMAMAVIIDAGASVMVEQICDDFEEDIKEQLSLAETHMTPPQIYFTSRFSPGYGDYPIGEQKRVLRYLDAQRKIGVNVTRDFLMIPRKSVTALIGMAHHPVSGRMASCDECVMKEKCTLRKEGKFCGDRF